MLPLVGNLFVSFLNFSLYAAVSLLRKYDASSRGFSLVELLIALVVFAIVIVSGFACVKMGLGLVDNARHHTRAAQIMQSEVERLRSFAWANLTALPAAKTQVSIASQFNDSSYATYTLSRTLSGAGDSRKITLEVNWTDMGGRSHKKTYVTQYTKGGLYDYIQ